MLAALVSVRRGFGASRPSSNRIMNSTHDAGRLLNALTTGALSSAVRPYACRMSMTSLVSKSGFSTTSRRSRSSSLA